MSRLTAPITLPGPQPRCATNAALPRSPCSSPVKRTYRIVFSNVYSFRMDAARRTAAVPLPLSSAPGAAPALGMSSMWAHMMTMSFGLTDPVCLAQTLRHSCPSHE